MYLLKNALVMSMAQPAFHGDVLIENGRISAVGEALRAPDNAQTMDCAGRYVLPGFIDAHCHIGMWEDGMGEEGATATKAPILLRLKCARWTASIPSTPALRKRGRRASPPYSPGQAAPM